MTGIDWGSAPAWASAILTGGSLLLGFYILLRDRRKEERQEAARVVAMYYPEYGDDHVAVQVRVALRNTADRPVYFPSVLFRRAGEVRPWPYAEDVVEPGDAAEVRVPKCIDGTSVQIVGFAFHDGDGCIWARDFASSGLIRKGHARRPRARGRRRRAIRRARVTA